jgi:hypothetical protein
VAEALGFEIVEQDDMTGQLRNHYARVREELLSNYKSLRENGSSAEYLDKMAVGLENWVKAADAGHHQVQHNEVKRFVLNHGKGLVSGYGNAGVKSPHFQSFGQCGHKFFLVVDQQHLD